VCRAQNRYGLRPLPHETRTQTQTQTQTQAKAQTQTDTTESRDGNEEEDKESTTDAESRTQAPTPKTAAGLIVHTDTLWGEGEGGRDMCRQEQRLGPDKTKTETKAVDVDGGRQQALWRGGGGVTLLGGWGVRCWRLVILPALIVSARKRRMLAEATSWRSVGNLGGGRRLVGCVKRREAGVKRREADGRMHRR
jgi:hypothetical protein